MALEDYGLNAIQGTEMLSSGDERITALFTAVAATLDKTLVQRTALPAAANLDAVKAPGIYPVTSWSGAKSLVDGSGVAVIPTAALGAGQLVVTTQGGNVVQEWTLSGGAPSQWIRVFSGTSWTSFRRTDSAIIEGNTAAATLDDLPEGASEVWNTAKATALGLPSASEGILHTQDVGTMRFVLWRSISGPVYHRARVNGVWRDWTRLDAGASASAIAAIPSTSGTKLVPLAVTLGAPDATAPSSGAWRLPLRWAAPITRWRAHVTNRQPKTGTAQGAVTLDGMWIADHAGNGAAKATPVQILGPSAVPTDGSDLVSGWRTEPLGDDVERLLCYAYTSTAAPWSLAGAGWSSTDRTAAQAQAPTGLSAVTTAPLDIWIEAETWATTPVLAAFGDSLSTGIGAAGVVRDSVVAQYCRAHKALPVHYTASGDSWAGWSATQYKATRWAGLSHPDAMIVAMGSNDIFQGADLATMQSRVAALLPTLQAITPALHLTTITPRDAVTGAQESVRKSYNGWLKTFPMGARSVTDIVPAISSDDETIRPEYSADGIHLVAAGYTAEANALPTITRPA